MKTYVKPTVGIHQFDPYMLNASGGGTDIITGANETPLKPYEFVK